MLRQAWRVPLTCARPFQSKASGLVVILAELGPRYGTHHEDVLAVATGAERFSVPKSLGIALVVLGVFLLVT